MEAFLVSTGVVALAEIGDKTQLLAFMLSARYRKPWPIIVGILAATLVNHGLAGMLAEWITEQFDPQAIAWVLAASFLLMAGWVLVPDKLEAAEEPRWRRIGVLGTTFVTFFLAEMGDKTQFATIAMVAQYQHFGAVVLGSTLGMMIANVPAVLLGDRLAGRLPVRAVRLVAALIFLGLAGFAAVAALGIAL
ncbi:TMEM165/GDT1 family protein [Verticiella sediminum]|uniref:GDT1 family protein n=1 Tax=Verticiella sediminum TaxID=1247510 RepID=A0A556ABN9_9BURK|nr:TMEM165/GDT1 family protein [Verticiella sediminum]TSH90298.1 TMEM165/GDT1 family protein [Verticiella sediminum]